MAAEALSKRGAVAGGSGTADPVRERVPMRLARGGELGRRADSGCFAAYCPVERAKSKGEESGALRPSTSDSGAAVRDDHLENGRGDGGGEQLLSVENSVSDIRMLVSGSAALPPDPGGGGAVWSPGTPRLYGGDLLAGGLYHGPPLLLCVSTIYWVAAQGDAHPDPHADARIGSPRIKCKGRPSEVLQRGGSCLWERGAGL